MEIFGEGEFAIYMGWFFDQDQSMGMGEDVVYAICFRSLNQPTDFSSYTWRLEYLNTMWMINYVD